MAEHTEHCIKRQKWGDGECECHASSSPATTLTPTMQKAADFARQHGGKLHRHPGGFWSGPDFQRWGTSFGSSTIAGMVKRGAAEYTNWKQGRNGNFPIEVTLME